MMRSPYANFPMAESIGIGSFQTHQEPTSISTQPPITNNNNSINRDENNNEKLMEISPPKKTSKPKKGPRGGVYDPFPLKLHRMLQYASAENMGEVVSWSSHGRAFKIHNSKAFASMIMPKFFNQSKYTSFQRQLNLYGFSRCSRGRDSGAYHHELFLRGKPDIAKELIRTKVKGNGHKTMKLVDTDPDFYSMTPMTPSSSSCDGDGTVVSASSVVEGTNDCLEEVVNDIKVEASMAASTPSSDSSSPVPEHHPAKNEESISAVETISQPLRISSNQGFPTNNMSQPQQASYDVVSVGPAYNNVSNSSSPRSIITETSLSYGSAFASPYAYQKAIHEQIMQQPPRTNTAGHPQDTNPSKTNPESKSPPFSQELNQSIFIHELAMGCTILCNLRRDTTKF